MIIGGMATIPQREATLRKVIDSIYGQVDKLYIALNGYKHIPLFLSKYKNCEYEICDNSKGDSMKFSHADTPNVYYFCFDDDLIYPSFHVGKLIKGIEKYGGLVGLHGRTYPRPFQDFLVWAENYKCLSSVDEDRKVDLLGSGVCAFHTNQFKVSVDDFKYPNMTDSFLCKLSYEQGVPQHVLAHRSTYFVYLNYRDTIWRSHRRDTSRQTEILKQVLV